MAEPGRKVRALNERRDNLRDKQTEMQQKIKILQNVIKENEAKMRELAAESQQLDQGLEEVESVSPTPPNSFPGSQNINQRQAF